MKKVLLTAGTTIVLLILFSFEARVPREPDAQNHPVIRRQTSDWGDWKKVSCYRGIQFRLSRGEFYDGKYFWNVQFRNLYNREVKFGYNIVDPEKEAQTRRERNILDVWRLAAGFDPDEEGNNRDAPHGGNWANSSSNVFVYITNVQFSTNGTWNNEFINCDN